LQAFVTGVADKLKKFINLSKLRLCNRLEYFLIMLFIDFTRVYFFKIKSMQLLFDWFIKPAGSRYFCESLFWASQPKQAAKT
jgi:hypothetical protein